MSGCLICQRGSWPGLWASAETREKFRISACDKHRAEDQAQEENWDRVGRIMHRHALEAKVVEAARPLLESAGWKNKAALKKALDTLDHWNRKCRERGKQEWADKVAPSGAADRRDGDE